MSVFHITNYINSLLLYPPACKTLFFLVTNQISAIPESCKDQKHIQ